MIDLPESRCCLVRHVSDCDRDSNVGSPFPHGSMRYEIHKSRGCHFSGYDSGVWCMRPCIMAVRQAQKLKLTPR